MTNSERLKELKELDETSGDILSSDYRFNKWHSRVSGLIGFDPMARHKFDALCDYILKEHEFHNHMIYENVVQAEHNLRAVVARCISELEINRPDEDKPKATPIIPRSASTKVSAEAVDKSTPSNHSNTSKALTKDEGFLWFWHHCHYTVKWKLFGMFCAAATTIAGIGWIANEQEVLRDIGRAFQKFSKPTQQAPDDNKDLDSD